MTDPQTESDARATREPVIGRPAEVLSAFLKLGLTSFGGPVAHIGYFRREFVERRAWLQESQYVQLLAVCQFLPGPASSQMGFAIGLLRAGWLGALAASLAFTLPSVALLLLFAWGLPYLQGEVGAALIHGLKLVALVVVADAVIGMARKLCPDATRRWIALVAAALVLSLASLSAQLLVVIGGALAGVWLCRDVASASAAPVRVPVGRGTAISLFALFFGLLIGLAALATQHMLLALADGFYRAGALVFGGGHVVLPLLEQAAVEPGWLSETQFLAGYGAAQAVPGPMFAVSAYLGALMPNEAGSGLNGVAAMIAVLAMFLPGLLLIAAAMPFWQAISMNPRALHAISGVNAAVVGILGAALYDPIFTSAVESAADLALALIGFALLAVARLSPLFVVVWCVSASLAIRLIG